MSWSDENSQRWKTTRLLFNKDFTVECPPLSHLKRDRDYIDTPNKPSSSKFLFEILQSLLSENRFPIEALGNDLFLGVMRIIKDGIPLDYCLITTLTSNVLPSVSLNGTETTSTHQISRRPRSFYRGPYQAYRVERDSR